MEADLMSTAIKRIISLLLVMFVAVSAFVLIPPVNASAEYSLGYRLRYEGKYVYLTIEPKDSADTIYYTTNGKTPTAKSKVLTGAIKASKKVTVKAIELDKSGKRAASLKITIKPRVQAPDTGLVTVDGKKYVKITAVKGAKIYYTTDGSEPTKKSSLYTGPVPYTAGTVVSARAYKSGMTASKVVTFSVKPEALDFKPSAEVSDVFKLTNEERRAHGSSDLILDPELCAAAETRAKELATLYDHKRPDGTRGVEIFDELGISFTVRGENIARKQTTAAQAVAAWMASDSHRAALLNEDFDSIGIGHYYANGIHYWVQLFKRQ